MRPSIIAWLFTEYDVPWNSHVLHWNFSIPRATSYSVNSQATVTVYFLLPLSIYVYINYYCIETCVARY